MDVETIYRGRVEEKKGKQIRSPRPHSFNIFHEESKLLSNAIEYSSHVSAFQRGAKGEIFREDVTYFFVSPRGSVSR